MRRSVAAGLVILLALATLALYIFISRIEAERTYVPIRLERAAQLAELMQTSVQDFARPGLPLKQYRGFDQETQNLLFTDPAISGASLIDTDGKVIFCHFRNQSHCSRSAAVPTEALPPLEVGRLTVPVFQDASHFRLDLGIDGNFGKAGSLQITLTRPEVLMVLDKHFQSVLLWSAALFILFAASTIIIEMKSEAGARQYVKKLFFMLQAAIIVVLCLHLFAIYLEGKTGQLEELATSLAGRINMLSQLGLSMDSISGLEETMSEYRQVDPELTSIMIVEDGRIILNAEKNGGQIFRAPPLSLVMRAPVDLIGYKAPTIVMTLPYSKLLLGVWQGARGMLTLLFGCTLLGSALMAAAHAYRERGHALNRASQAHTRLDIILPAYLIGVMVDAMIWPILPEYSRSLALALDISGYWVQLPFTLYFAALTLALIPAGRMIRTFGDRRAFEIGASAIAAGLFLVAFSDSFTLLCLGRMITGFGQGILLVTIQDIAFKTLPAEEKTRAAGIQVLGYSTGVIAGSGFGGLMAAFYSLPSSLILAASCSGAALFYSFFAVKTLRSRRRVSTETARGSSQMAGLKAILQDRQFVWILLTVGIVSKFTLTGIVMFAMPFLMIAAGYKPDTIGQALMFYSVIVYGGTRLAPKLSHSLSGEKAVISIGLLALVGGISTLVVAAFLPAQPSGGAPGLLFSLQSSLASFTGSYLDGGIRALCFIGAVILLGLGQALTASPALSAVSATPAALQSGRTQVLAIYRVLERAGHMGGPALVGILLAAGRDNALALLPVAAVILAAAALFRFLVKSGH